MLNGKCKVLCISGGGVCGVIPATFLEYVSQDNSLEGIDCIAGTSVGGILSLAYATGKSFESVSKMFRKRVKDCFKRRWISYINPFACPKYDSDSIDSVIKDLVGTAKVSDIKKSYPDLKVFVPSVNITDDKFKVYDNITGQDDDCLLKTICGQTSAAPSYFYGRDNDGKCMVDGGLLDNFCFLTATTGLKAKLGINLNDMDVLIIGTGTSIDGAGESITTKKYNDYGLLGLCQNVIVPYVTRSNMVTSVFWGNNLGFNSFEFYNPILIHNRKMDDVSSVPDLIRACENHKEEFIEVWNKWKNN